MTNAMFERTEKTSSGQGNSIAIPTAILIATDGTSQSDAAITIARLLPSSNGRQFKVLTVVDDTPIPWGAVDRSLVLDYKRGTLREAKEKASAQIRRLGDSGWHVEAQTGDPAAVIAGEAKESRVRLVIVGLGGHGPAARVFGNETALRLARISQTPVLAVDAKTRALPSRILVAMDFSEHSVEAARLALEIAAPGATMTLVHVVPWERKEYVPEQWFREHESHIAGQLKRVSGWLDHDNAPRIHQKILYGRPGPVLLACAEELNADLIVAGTHGRSFFGRLLGGETLSKLIRGARCSVLVFPRGAGFQRFERTTPERDAKDEIDWVQKLNHFSTRNAGRRAELEIDDPALGAQVEMSGYQFLGATYDIPTRRAQLMFGSLQGTEPHLVRGISNVKSVEVLSDPKVGADGALSIVSDDGQTLLLLEAGKETG